MHASGRSPAIILILIAMFNGSTSLLNGIFRTAITKRSRGFSASSYCFHSMSPLSLLLSENPRSTGRNGRTNQSSRLSFATKFVSGTFYSNLWFNNPKRSPLLPLKTLQIRIMIANL